MILQWCMYVMVTASQVRNIITIALLYSAGRGMAAWYICTLHIYPSGNFLHRQRGCMLHDDAYIGCTGRKIANIIIMSSFEQTKRIYYIWLSAAS